LPNSVITKLYKRALRNFADILILTELKNKTMSGYEILLYVNERYETLLSSGTIYSLLYSLERKGLIEGKWDDRRRVYKLTGKAKKNIKLFIKVRKELENFLKNIILLEATAASTTE